MMPSVCRNNFALKNGGSLYLSSESVSSNVTITNSYFINNTASLMGAAIYIASEKLKANLLNTRFFGNKAQTDKKIAAFPSKILVTDE